MNGLQYLLLGGVGIEDKYVAGVDEKLNYNLTWEITA